MAELEKTYTVKPRDFIRAGEVSIQIQSLLKSMGVTPDIVRRASVCAYESEMNIVMYGGEGTFTLRVDQDMIMIRACDDGPGIDDIELAFQEGYSTATPEYREIGFGAGMGLPNIKKNSDEIQVESHKGEGTCLVIYIKIN